MVSQAKISLPAEFVASFIARHQLPATFRRIAEEHYVPLAAALPNWSSSSVPILLGISGAQGTGKSTLADFLGGVCAIVYDWNVAVLSLDDFYRTRQERMILANSVHPLLRTRGVPGTHDIPMLMQCLRDLKQLRCGDRLPLPKFNKAVDDREPVSRWPDISGPVNLIILEGWCVGSSHQSDDALDVPVNALERDEDPDGVWRRYVNDQLKTHYAEVFRQIDRLIYLAPPNFASVIRWRNLQERKLAESAAASTAAILSRSDIERFVLHYERLTLANRARLSASADRVFWLDDAHVIAKVTRPD